MDIPIQEENVEVLENLNMAKTSEKYVLTKLTRNIKYPSKPKKS